ncbi:MAG TPA: DUF3237 family protein [Streptosporangiaceae bacterium]|nr:DUF3237 family protein [Streptosporangiaceae bacterium]
MAEQLPGELIYRYNLKVTGVTSYGAPAMDAVVSGAAGIPPPGARYDLALEGRIAGQRLRGTVNGVDYIHIRPDGRAQLHIHAEITTEDDKKIALYADGVVSFRAGSSVGDLRENVTLTTSEPAYAWVNPFQIWALGTVDMATGDVDIAGYAV